MRSISRLLMSLVALCSITALLPREASAASRGTCENYARDAVEQFRITERVRRCNRRSDGRWHANFQVHFSWCLTAPIGSVRFEQNTRNDALARCGGRVRID